MVTYNKKRSDIKRAKLKALAKKRQPLKYFVPISHPELNQKAFVESTKRDRSVFGGNRAGKTLIGAYDIIKQLLKTPNLKARAATFQKLSITIQQKAVYDMLPKDSSVSYAIFTDTLGFRHNMIQLANGSVLRFQTYEQGWSKFQGPGHDIEWNDEEAPEEVVKEQKMRLVDRNGQMIRTMTPLNGITYTYDDVVESKDPEVDYWFFDGDFNPYINQKARTRILNQFPEKEREVRAKGSWISLNSGQAYYAFSKENIIPRKKFKYDPNLPIELTWDFNVALMTVGVHQNHKGKDYLFDYVELENHANTELLCKQIKERYKNHHGGFIHYGDTAGASRSTTTSWTDWGIIQSEFPNSPCYHQQILSISDRVLSTNARLKSYNDEIFYYICDNCIRHIGDFRKVTWEMLLHKKLAKLLTHASDGCSYMMLWKYPLTTEASSTIF